MKQKNDSNSYRWYLIIKRFSAFLFAIMLMMSIASICFPAYAWEDAANRITIYTQNNYTSKTSWSLRGSKNPTTLKAAGCHLFAYAHAYQWLSGTKANDNLLRELISVCRNPSDGPKSNKASEDKNHTYCGTDHKDSTSAYNTWMKSKIGNQLEILSETKTKALVKSESSLKSFYDNGGVIISNPGSHYVVSVGYRVYNGTTYIQIVDSSRWTTIKYDGKKAYNISDITKSAISEPNKGDRYWVSLSTYLGFRHDNAFSIKQSPLLPESIQLNTSNAVLYVDSSNTLLLAASVYPSNASNAITWTSSDSTVATVSNGVVTPVGIGNATITATSSVDSSIMATCHIETRYNGTGMIKYNEIIFPYKYKINSGGFAWKNGSGSISSDVNLSSVTFTIYPPGYPSKEAIKYTKSNINSKTLNMVDVGSQIKFSQLNSAGEAFFEITATDIVGRTLSLGRAFDASTSGGITSSDASTTSNRQYRINTSWQEPVLVDTTTYGDHTYARYKATYKWTEANAYAKHLGGHLATISSAEENAAIYSIVKKDANYGAWIGCSHINGINEWVTGEPMNYQNWYSGEPSNSWGKEFYGAMRITDGKWRDSCNNDQNWMYFIVEFEPQKTEQIIIEGESSPTEGDIFTLSATVLPEDSANKTVIYSSSEPTVATVDALTGVVTALSEGETVITATAQDNGAIENFVIHVQRKLIAVTGVELSVNDSSYNSIEKEISIKLGQSFTLNPTILPLDADNPDVTYLVSESDIIQVEDYNNIATACGIGTCTITVITYDGEYSDSITVNVLPVSGSCGENLTWELNESTLIISGIGDMENFSLNGSPWFIYENIITKIVLSDGVSSIGDYAFYHCTNLSETHVPNSILRIGQGAFELCTSLSDFAFPTSLIEICYNAFAKSGLTNIILPNGLLTLGPSAFENCVQLSSVSLPNTIGKISIQTFAHCYSLTSIKIPESVSTIRLEAFYDCGNLLHVYLPANVSTIEFDAFSGINPDALIHVFRKSFAEKYAKEKNLSYAYIDSVKSAPDLWLPAALTVIEDEAFAGNPSEWIRLSNNVTSIGYRAFADCLNLTQIYIPASTNYIDPYAFENVPEGLTIFGKAGSYAETFAANNGYDFRSSGQTPSATTPGTHPTD